MPATSGRTEWAANVVIFLQLAAWSAVGIVLIQKGMTSLRDKSTTVPRVNDAADHQPDAVPSRRETYPVDQAKGYTWNDEEWRLEENRNVLHGREPRNPGRNEEAAESDVLLLEERDDGVPFSEDGISKKMNKVESKEARRTNGSDVVAFGEGKTKILEDEEYPAEVSAFDAGEADVTKARKNGKVIGGAAIAVAMLSVGAIMLLLGPAVVILRTLDERRQRRRFLKLATANDLPPSYEQATLMDEAPRYSTLRLNNT